MREIKFRAWNKEYKHFANVQEDSDYMLGFNDDGSIYMIQGGSPAEKEYELMQFTGLKDKNGKEIYEGDIIETRNPKQNRYSVGSVIWKSDVCGFELYDFNCKFYKVLGNIHENPELLNA
jgi:uncharacterized phage protein (TIGR01671 family)